MIPIISNARVWQNNKWVGVGFHTRGSAGPLRGM